MFPFSALLLVANQGGNQHPKSHSSYRKLLLLHMGQKLAKTKTNDTLHDKSFSSCR